MEINSDAKSDASLSFSEDSPDKKNSLEKKDEVRGRDLASGSTSKTLRNFVTPRSSPSPSTRLRRVNSRTSSLKRSSSLPLAIPNMPRRGRAAVSPAEMWGDAGRMVHRRVEQPAEASAEDVLRNVIEQLTADRAAMVQMHGAIGAVALVVNTHDEGMTALGGRLAEQTRMRLDDHRLHIGPVTHIRTGVEDLSRSQIKLAEHVDVQNKSTWTELEKTLQDITDKVNEAVP